MADSFGKDREERDNRRGFTIKKSLTKSIAGACFVAFTVAAQGILLRQFEATAGTQTASFWLLALLAGAAFLVFSRSSIARSLIVTFGAGGLGMLIGMSRDGMSDHMDHVGYLTIIPTWMTLFMVVFCLPACSLLCRNPSISRARSFQLHCFAAITMIAGMLLGSAWLAGIMTQWLGSTLLGHYAAMVTGMCAGTAVGMVTFFNLFSMVSVSASR